CLDGAPDAGDQSATANARDDSVRVWRVFENFQANCSMTGYKIVVVERVNERSGSSRKRTFLERLPCDLVRDRNQFRVERCDSLTCGADVRELNRTNRFRRCGHVSLV